MTDEQRRVTELAAYLANAARAEPDAVTIGLSDAELVSRALLAYAAALAAL